MLLKIVLLGYSRGLVSSRSIEAACRHNVLFMAVSGDACPHFTTLAADALPTEADEARATHTRERLSREAAQIRQWLAEHPADRQGSTRLSNRTDNESAKMATGKGCTFNSYAMMKFRRAERDCMPCPLRHNKRLTRFTLRGRAKVDGQWKRYCIMHNIEKLAHHGYGE